MIDFDADVDDALLAHFRPDDRTEYVHAGRFLNAPRAGRLPPAPPETPHTRASRDLSIIAPQLAKRVTTIVLPQMLARGHDAYVFEAFRSDARAAYLYGFGRSYDDGRGIVTNARDASRTYHRYGLAVDIISQSREWDAPSAFWSDLRKIATAAGLRSGDDWDRDGVPVGPDPDESYSDRPHVQWWIPGMRTTPSDHAWIVLHARGMPAVWDEVHAR